MNSEQFSVFIDRAIAAIPEKFRTRMDNLAFVVEDEPPVLDDDDPDAGDLLGLFDGIPLTERSIEDNAALPDKITLFRRPIEEEAADADEPMEKVIRETVWHEVAHYFGFEEEDAERLCDKWEERWQELSQ